jgi:hypothetical protein
MPIHFYRKEQIYEVTSKYEIIRQAFQGEGIAIRQSRADLNVSNCTITNNAGGIIAGDLSHQGTWTVKSSIVASNLIVGDVLGVFNSAGFNLIRSSETMYGEPSCVPTS